MLSEIADNEIVTENKEELDIWNKLEQYVKNHYILIGTVRELRKYTVNDHEKHVDLVVTMDDYEVIIPEEEVVTFIKSYTPLSLVGEQIRYTITDIFPDQGLVFGSMQEADRRNKEPTLKKLYSKEILSGTIVSFTSAGAYIDVGHGVQGFLRNCDFSPTGRRVEDVYKRFMELRVIYDHTTVNGTIIFHPQHLDHEEVPSEIYIFERGKMYKGRINKVFPDRVYVTMRAKVDCLCSYPMSLGKLCQGECVSVKITKVNGMKLRGEIYNRIE